MFKIASLDENDQIRKLVVTNLVIKDGKEGNLDKLLVRLRDKNVDVRLVVVKKMQNESYGILGKKSTFGRFSQSQVYKMLYDGFGSKEGKVRGEWLHYFGMFFDHENANDGDFEQERRVLPEEDERDHQNLS